MRFITIKKRRILFSILFICFVWLGYISLGLDNLFHKEDGEVKTKPDNEEVLSMLSSDTEALSDLALDKEIIAVGEKKTNNYDDYFVNYRIEREKIRSQQVEILREIVDNPNSLSEIRKNAQEKMLTITQTMENELKLENLIKAKNFPDAVVLIQPESVMVVVKVMELADADGTKIADLVSNTTGHNYENIIISTKE